jgi:pimeloyl-ACP methyl ester carboxylesterase
LNGLLTLPENITEPVPAVVFVHGSGSSNMDEKVGQLTPFKDLAEGLANKGIASIRYDKRSFAHGLKMVRDKSTIITVKEETIDDAILATELLKKDSRIDSHNIFIIGHSMGGMLAPRIDSEGGKYKGLIIMAGTPRKLEDVMLEQNEDVLSSTKGLVNWIVRKQVAKLSGLFSGLYELSDEEAKKKKVMGGTTLYYFKEMGEHSVADYLATTKKPMLIVQGEKDFQVSVEKDFNEYVTFHVTSKDGADVEMAVVDEFEYDHKQYVVGAVVEGDTILEDGLYIYRSIITGDDFTVEKIEKESDYKKIAQAYMEMDE